jgi:hypothetical protein
MEDNKHNNNDNPEIKEWMLKIERRLSRLEGKMNVVLVILSGILAILAAIITKI